jgi:hypothetical protein
MCEYMNLASFSIFVNAFPDLGGRVGREKKEPLRNFLSGLKGQKG